MLKVGEKAIRITGEYHDWTKLVYDYPEIRLIKKHGIIIGVHFPKDSVGGITEVKENKITDLKFFDTKRPGTSIHYLLETTEEI